MGFQPEYRVMLEQETDNLSQQVVARLHGIEDQARKMRKVDSRKNTSPRTIELDLMPQVDQLIADLDVARAQTVTAIDEDIEQRRRTWTEDRDKHPEREIAEIRRAENMIRGKTDAEVAEMTMQYAGGDADLDAASLNEIRARLRQGGHGAELEVLDKGISERYGDRPWISADPEAVEMVGYRRTLSQLKTGQVSLAGDTFRAKIRDLVDFHDELSKVSN